MLKSKVHCSCSLCSVCWCMCGCLRARLCVIFFLINLLCVFFINLLHLQESSPPTPLPRSLPPVHRWGFSTSAVTGPKQGGRLALPPGVAKEKTLKAAQNEPNKGNILLSSIYIPVLRIENLLSGLSQGRSRFIMKYQFAVNIRKTRSKTMTCSALCDQQKEQA